MDSKAVLLFFMKVVPEACLGIFPEVAKKQKSYFLLSYNAKTSLLVFA